MKSFTFNLIELGFSHEEVAHFEQHENLLATAGARVSRVVGNPVLVFAPSNQAEFDGVEAALWAWESRNRLNFPTLMGFHSRAIIYLLIQLMNIRMSTGAL